MSEKSAKTLVKTVVSFSMTTVEVFAREEGGKTTISGYAAKFDTYSEDLGGFRTTIAPGAFDKVLQSAPDVRFLVNHDQNLILGRTSSGTLRLKSDETGLYFDGDPPDTAMANHYVSAIRRRDITGCSFSCYIADDGEEWNWSGPMPIRKIFNLSELIDVGPVTLPAFLDTSVLAASRFTLEQARKSLSDDVEGAARRRRRAVALFQMVSLGQ